MIYEIKITIWYKARKQFKLFTVVFIINHLHPSVLCLTEEKFQMHFVSPLVHCKHSLFARKTWVFSTDLRFSHPSNSSLLPGRRTSCTVCCRSLTCTPAHLYHQVYALIYTCHTINVQGVYLLALTSVQCRFVRFMNWLCICLCIRPWSNAILRFPFFFVLRLLFQPCCTLWGLICWLGHVRDLSFWIGVWFAPHLFCCCAEPANYGNSRIEGLGLSGL